MIHLIQIIVDWSERFQGLIIEISDAMMYTSPTIACIAVEVTGWYICNFCKFFTRPDYDGLRGTWGPIWGFLIIMHLSVQGFHKNPSRYREMWASIMVLWVVPKYPDTRYAPHYTRCMYGCTHGGAVRANVTAAGVWSRLPRGPGILWKGRGVLIKF